MITIDEKLYITKEVNNVVVSYAKKVILRKLLFDFSFEKKSKIVSSILENTNFCNGDLNPDVEFEMLEFIHPFLAELNKNDSTALYFWAINNLYLKYLEDFDENTPDDIFDFKFGRKLAHKLYEPASTELEDELFEELKNLLVNYASEFDLSLIDEYTEDQILKTINLYC